jgi:hypothetical protein
MKRRRASKRETTTKRAMATTTWVTGDEEGDGNGGRSGGEGNDVDNDKDNNNDNDDKDNDWASYSSGWTQTIAKISAKARNHKEIHFILNWKKMFGLIVDSI